MADRLILARIGAAHGIRGAVRVKTFTADPASLGEYGVLEAADGRHFTVRSFRPVAGSPDMLVVQFQGVGDRNAAEALNGIELGVPRDRLPAAAADEFYHADLVGLAAVASDGTALGTVIAVPNYGAGDLLEIAPARGASRLIPFTRAFVPEVDLAAGRVLVEPPAGWFDEPGDEAGQAE